jgi:two-component system sensor histidine kinase/response regulator
MLEKAGFSIVIANHGREALSLLTEQEFDFVLMDVQMPEMDGFEAASAIRLSEKVTGEHIPIVGMTAHTMKGDEARCPAAGMDGYISKPIRARDLVELLEKYGRRALIPSPFESTAIVAV